jgi:hypothetical protein
MNKGCYMRSNKTSPSVNEEDSNCDSEEEGHPVQPFLDDTRNPLLLPLGNMLLEMAKTCINNIPL